MFGTELNTVKHDVCYNLSGKIKEKLVFVGLIGKKVSGLLS